MATWRQSADEGEADAQFNLGHCYEVGIGASQDYVEAARLYQLAAAQGYARAQCNLGRLYSQGCGVPQDLVEAARLLQLAAAQGDDDAREALSATRTSQTGITHPSRS
jgi:hypothetical protein